MLNLMTLISNSALQIGYYLVPLVHNSMYNGGLWAFNKLIHQTETTWNS